MKCNVYDRGISYKSCSINEIGLKLHIVNEKLEEIHHGIVSITESIPANEYNLYLHIDRSTSFCAHWCIYFRIHSNVCYRRYGSKMDAENRFLSVLMATF